MTLSADLDEMVGPELGLRLSVELGAALRRRPAHEAGLAGVLRILIGHCERLREAGGAALDVLVRRNTLARPLYGALLRALVEFEDARVTVPLCRALAREDGGGLPTIAAAALSDDAAVESPLAHLASSRSSQVAFAAELARVARRESDGKLLGTIAPRIKESHRIELASQLMLPLVRRRRRVEGATQALDILRDSERHLGRWLCMAELALLTGESNALVDAQRMAKEGPQSARAAWGLVAWALAPSVECAVRPTVELMARLSDRPSAERDLSFLFRMADAGQAAAKSMLESLAKTGALTTDVAIRAAAQLVRNHGRDDLVRRLHETATNAKREPVRGLALAAIADCRPSALSDFPSDLIKSRHHATVGFAVLVKLSAIRNDGAPIITEPNYRRLQLGWSD